MHELRLMLHADTLAYRFCNPRQRADAEPAPARDVLAKLEAADRRHVQRVTLAGGAPLAHPDLEAIVARCRELALPRIGLELDGASLAAPGALDRVERLGIDELFVVVGALREKVHDLVMGERGTFKAAFVGLHAALQRQALRTYLVVPVLRHNLDDLEPLLAYALKAGGKLRGYLLALPVVNEVPPEARKLLASYNDQAQTAARLFRACQGQNVEYGFASRRGLAPCAAHGSLDRFATVFHERMTYLRHARPEPFERVDACGDCSLSESCPGMESAYLETFGRADLAPIPLDVSMDWKLRRQNRLEQREYKHHSPFENESAVNPRGLVRINGHCNMSCAFCFVDRTAPDFAEDELRREISDLAAGGTRHLVLSGGEPTLHPDLPGLIEHGRALGFDVIEMQSNGVRAAERAYAESLVSKGLSKVTVSLHSVDPETSDRITRLPQAFGKSIDAIHNFRSLGVETQIAHVITKANYQELPQTVRFLRDTFPASGGSLSICFAIAQEISDLVFSWVIPRFDEVKPYFKEALDHCLATGVGFGGMIGQGGYPPCMLDGEMKYYEMNLPHVFRSSDWSDQFYKAERCKTCSFDPWCVGVRKGYIDHYGDAEIRPFQAIINAPEPVRLAAPEAKPAPTHGRLPVVA